MSQQSVPSHLRRSLEAPFLRALEEIARSKDLSFDQLTARIDAERGTQPLLTAVRLYALEYYRTHAHLPGFSEEEAGRFVHAALNVIKTES
mgnify:CR=1 FL=1